MENFTWRCLEEHVDSSHARGERCSAEGLSVLEDDVGFLYRDICQRDVVVVRFEVRVWVCRTARIFGCVWDKCVGRVYLALCSVSDAATVAGAGGGEGGPKRLLLDPRVLCLYGLGRPLYRPPDIGIVRRTLSVLLSFHYSGKYVRLGASSD